MYDAQKPIEFIARKQDSIRPVEQRDGQAAVELFHTLIDELYKTNTEQLATTETDDGMRRKLNLRIDAEDGSQLDFEVRHGRYEEDGESHEFHRIAAIVYEPYDRWGILSYWYDLSEDGSEIRRRRQGDLREVLQLDQDIMNGDDEKAKIAEMEKVAENTQKNRELEEQMGLNNQVVGVAEMMQLRELMLSATPYVSNLL